MSARARPTLWPRARRFLLLGLAALGGTSALLCVAHVMIGYAARLDRSAGDFARGEPVETATGLRVLGRSYLVHHDGITEIGLRGTPAEIGWAHTRLARREMIEVEGALFRRFQAQVDSALTRALLLDLAQLRFRTVDRGMGAERLDEIAAMADAFDADPFTSLFPTYQRYVYLNALYDIALSFERSPLVGCTSFVLDGLSEEGPTTLLARAFDFEVDEVFDQRKAVFLVHEQGALPFASVAWPGLVGVVSGMNAEGLALVVHGARAGPTRTEGEPVVHALRRVLSTAADVPAGVARLGEREPLVSHLVILADAIGRGAVVERIPGAAPHVRALPRRAAVTNHIEGPAASDEKNQRVLDTTSTLARRRRGDELIAELAGGPVGIADALRLLRDRRAAGGAELVLGDRRAIDALIAAHGVIMDTRHRVLWVSTSPHLLGRFVAFDLRALLAPNHDPTRHSSPRVLPEDELLNRGEYAAWRAANPR